MKLILFSDNHRNRESVDQILKRHPDADRFISLGDSEMRESELNERNIIGVKGNYPFEPDFPDSLLFVFDDWKIYFTHGHRLGVKMGLSRLYELARDQDIQVVCFGHTHRAILEEIDDIVFLNPGSLTFPKGFAGSSYAIIYTSIKEIRFEIHDIVDDKILYQLKKRRKHEF